MTFGTLAYRFGCLIHWAPREAAIRQGLESLPAPTIAGARLVDVGSGLGQLSRLAHELGLEYLGLEPDDALREEAAHEFAGAAFLPSGAAGLPDVIRPADLVVLNGVAHHLDDGLLEKTLRTAHAARGLILCDHLRLDGETHALARFLQDRDQGKFVRPYEVLRSPSGFALQSSRFFPIGPLGMPFWTYFCNVYTTS
ncbi:MAG: class I SAM-dependent methyltransferase [Vicinamibacteria bacterium]|nr:class I SAM-dependent methyltransferase [Vicinamibacteria bacterium]